MTTSAKATHIEPISRVSQVLVRHFLYVSRVVHTEDVEQGDCFDTTCDSIPLVVRLITDCHVRFDLLFRESWPLEGHAQRTAYSLVSSPNLLSKRSAQAKRAKASLTDQFLVFPRAEEHPIRAVLSTWPASCRCPLTADYTAAERRSRSRG